MITIPGRIPIRIHPIFWAFVLVISALNSDTPFRFFSWIFVIFTSVIIHEMGHALTAIAFGQRAHIDLLGFGGITQRKGKTLSEWKDFLVVLNGPLAGFMLCIGSYFLLNRNIVFSPNILFLLELFLYANLFWTVVNLIPVQPLDGGHLLRIILEGLFGVRGVKTALFISLILAIGFTIFFFAYNIMLVGVLFMMLTYENYRGWKASLDMTASDKSQPLQKLLKEAQRDYQSGDSLSAINKLQNIRNNASKGLIFLGASIMLAEIWSKEGKNQEAFELLNPLRNKLPANALRLLQEIAFQIHRWDDAIAIGTQAYQTEPLYETAVLNAISYAQRNESPPAVGWLKCAVKDGLPKLEDVVTMSEFDPIRHDPLFTNFVKSA